MPARRCTTALAAGAAIAMLIVAPDAGAAVQPSAACTDGLTRLDLRLGQAIPLPRSYSNPTSSTVRFTARMTSNRFFGPARPVASVTLPAHTGRIRSTIVPTFLHTPIGTGPVTIEVRTDRTGTDVVGRCEYQLHLAAPPGVDAGTILRPAKRFLLQIPVQPCAIEGSALAGTRRSGATVPVGRLLGTIAQLNDTIWYPQAQIAFSVASDVAIPVIDDPQLPAGGSDGIGDVSLFPLAEVRGAAELCRAAWRRQFGASAGIPLVNARRLLEAGDTLAAAPPPDAGLYVLGRKFGSGKRGDDLCGSPVRVTRADVTDRFVVLRDHDGLPQPVNALAHELGHNLFLGHGNGLDDDRDGRPAGMAGPRRYDEYCDPDWLAPPLNTEVAEDQATPFTGCAASSSLMNLRASCTNLRPLQVETARGVARVVPGAVDGTPRPVADPTQ